MEELPRGDWWICPPLYRHTINHLFHFEMPVVFLACVQGLRKVRVRVRVRATLALQLDFSVF